MCNKGIPLFLIMLLLAASCNRPAEEGADPDPAADSLGMSDESPAGEAPSADSSEMLPSGEPADSSARRGADVAAAGQIAPNEARIRGTVLAISDRRTSAPEDPCSQAPCFATVRIDTVYGYGAAFPQPLTSGTEVPVRFTFSLWPSERLDLQLDRPLSGLEPGNAFRADVRAAIVPGRDAPAFTVFEYDPIRNTDVE